jgi:hypothetical protein
VFSSADFLSAGTRAAVDQALFRLMKAGTIVRVARGLYAAAGQQVDAQTVAEGGFDVLGIDGLLVMKSIVVYDRVKSRDIYDLMVLTRDHGYTLDDIFAAIDAYQPIRNKDPEHFKSVVTGVIALDKDDEGFSSIHLDVKMDEIYKYFKKLISNYEIRAVQRLRT